MVRIMGDREFEEEREERADQWSSGGVMPDADETWSVPADDPDATWPLNDSGARQR